MEGRGPYRIYDPGGSTPLGEASAAFERLVEENIRLKGKIQGIKMLGKAAPPPCWPSSRNLQCQLPHKGWQVPLPITLLSCDPVLTPGICVHFCSLVMAFLALTSPTPKGIFEGPRGKHAWGENRKPSL